MKVKDIVEVLDPYIGVWLNDGEESNYYCTVDDIESHYYEEEINYITTDAHNQLTIEIMR